MTAPASSPRHLVLKNLASVIARDVVPSAELPAREIIAPPNQGDMALYSAYQPSLLAGPTYTIQGSQKITLDIPTGASNAADSGAHDLPMDDAGKTTISQPFTVVAPQFKIDVKDVHSTYPPPGHADQPNVLPHIVFNDPHLPWERRPEMNTVDIADDKDTLPWLTVVPFDCTGPNRELELSPSQLNGPSAIHNQPATGSLPLKQSATFSISMTLCDYLNLGTRPTIDDNASSNTGTSPKVFLPGEVPSVQDDLTTPVDVIFITGKLFRQLFTMPTDPKTVDVSQYRFCAHVRNVNTEGMTDAGVQDKGLFSIILSRRSGPLDIIPNTPPRTQAVHMISLEALETKTELSSMADTDLIAFVSLYSWTYLCQPPLSVNFVDCKSSLQVSTSRRLLTPQTQPCEQLVARSTPRLPPYSV